MKLAFEDILDRIVRGLQQNPEFASVVGSVTGARGAGRAQLYIDALIAGESRRFLFHIQREAPGHTIAASVIDDTIRTVGQKIVHPATGDIQPNDIYFPSALGLVPTRIPGQPTSVTSAVSQH